MTEIKQIARELSSGNIENARKINKEIARISDESLQLEVMEIAKQAMISHLKKGEVATVRKISEVFSMPRELVEDTIQQAVLSAFAEGDIARVRALKEELPISRDLGAKLVLYCASWGKSDKSAAMEMVFA